MAIDETTPADAISDYWQRLGVRTTRVPTSPQQAQDSEREATFPAFLVRGTPQDAISFMALHSSRAWLRSNGFRSPSPRNIGRYMNPVLDALIERYWATVPVPERIEVIGEIIRHVADQVVVVGIYYNPSPAAVANRLVNLSPGGGGGLIWNAHEWDLKS